jgi:two-component system cell cycle response regulator DivK
MENIMPKQKKIFIVEDNDLNLKLFRDLLEANNFLVEATQDGHEAYDLIKESKPNLILMDIQLRGISGLDIIKQIKNDDKLKNIPIIAVTAFAMKNDRQKIMDAGCAEYISKPISIELFIKTVNEFVG